MEQTGKNPATRMVAKVIVIASAMLTAAVLSSAAHAEYLGLLAGREATPAKSADLTVEIGMVSGDVSEQDYQNIAARVNYRLSPELVLMGTAGTGQYGETDGVPLGLGVLYHLSKQRISQSVEIAGRALYHFGEYTLPSLKGDLSSLALEVLVSGADPLMSNGLSWYTSVGFHRTTVDFGNSDSANDIGFSAGLVLPNALGEAYLGLEHIDGLAFGFGIRYFVQ